MNENDRLTCGTNSTPDGIESAWAAGVDVQSYTQLTPAFLMAWVAPEVYHTPAPFLDDVTTDASDTLSWCTECTGSFKCADMLFRCTLCAGSSKCALTADFLWTHCCMCRMDAQLHTPGVRSSKRNASDCPPQFKTCRAPHLDDWAPGLSIVGVKIQSSCLRMCAAVQLCQLKRHSSEHLRQVFLWPWQSSIRGFHLEMSAIHRALPCPSQVNHMSYHQGARHPLLLPWQPQEDHPSHSTKQSATQPEHCCGAR